MQVVSGFSSPWTEDLEQKKKKKRKKEMIGKRECSSNMESWTKISEPRDDV